MKDMNQDTKIFLLLLIISFVSVYFLPSILNKLFFLFVLFAIWRTKFDYVYLLWFLIINNAPGRLFQATASDETMRIPLYTLTGGISLSFQDLFIVLFLLKYIVNKEPSYFFLRKEFQIFLIVLGGYVLYSVLLGTGLDELVKISRSILPWTLILIIPRYTSGHFTMRRLSALLFPFVFITFIATISSYFTGEYWDYILRDDDFRNSLAVDNDKISRASSASFIIFFSSMQALYYFFDRDQNAFNKNYLLAVFAVSFIIIFLSGTRGWIIAYVVLFVCIFIVFGLSRNVSKMLRLWFSIFLLLLIMTSQVPFIKTQVELVIERLETVQSLTEGDLTAEGTLSRLDKRGPRVMSKFKESPVLGWGFSREYFLYKDQHVGHHTILLNTGVVGYLYLNLLFFFILLKMNRIIKDVHLNNGTYIYIFALISIYVIHSSSTIFWGYDIALIQIMNISLIYSAFNSGLITNMSCDPNHVLTGYQNTMNHKNCTT